MYSAHLVATAVAPAVPAAAPPAPPAPDAPLVILVYDVATAVPAVQFHPAPAFGHAQPSLPHNTVPQVHVASTVPQVPPVDAAPDQPLLPAVALFPRRDIFAVPVRVRVPETYIAYHAGLSVIPVLTVRLA